MEEFTIEVDLAKYKYVDLEVNEAKRFLKELAKLKEKKVNDINEAIRYLDNFDEFYNYMKKKFKDFLAIPHKPDDYLRSAVVVDKLKLYVDSKGGKRVVLVLDRKVALEDIEKALKTIGYANIKIRKMY